MIKKIIFNYTKDYMIQVLFYEGGETFIIVHSRKDARSIAKPGVPGYGKYPEAEVNRMINFLER